MGDRAKSGNWNPRMRNVGNPNARPDMRQPHGRSDVAPAQGKNIGISPRSWGARYKLGAPIRPKFDFDYGFLGKFPPRKPEAADYAALVKWQTILAGAEALRPDLEEGTKAYRHFLEGGGADRTFSYEDYVHGDNSGAITLANAMLDIQDGAEEIWEANPAAREFQITGDAIGCGDDLMFPYPETENWQKAIGGHVIWLSGKVQVVDRAGETWFVLDMTLHAEDRYNFNPGQHDITTGIPDDDNGRFELTGLGKQYIHRAELRRIVEWKYGTLGTGETSKASIPWR